MPAHIQDIKEFATNNNLYLIEDACQSHGAEVEAIRVGNWGDCAAFSFNQNKTICAGDAGMFVTNNKEMYEIARRFWSFGENRTPNHDRDYHAYALGWMYRSNDLTAAFGRSQLSKANNYIEWQRTNAHLLSKYLMECSSICIPKEPLDYYCTYSSYVLRLNSDFVVGNLKYMRECFVKALESEGLLGHITVWQRYILPKMTVFLAKNAYGKGCPWTCSHYGNFRKEDSSKFPISQKHCDSSFCLNTILRQPPNEKFIKMVAECFLKIDSHIDELNK